MKKNYFFTIVVIFVFAFIVASFSGCGIVRDVTYIKQTTVGVSNVKTEQETESGIKSKRKNIKINNVKIVQNVIYAPEIGYDSISKEERLKYSDKTDKKYGLFRYRFYYDYLTPEVILVFIDVDSNFYFESAVDQTGVKFELKSSWPKDNLFGGTALYKELYTIYLPFEYVKANKDKGIVIDLISNSTGHTNNLGAAFFSEAENLSRTFHIPQFYIKGFLSAIDKYKPEQNK
ncbi:MAG: hypothetical protein FWF73_07725 [Spirochaetes bacterium]|nr:hypothetical protein [Spirochaetota bacterium]